jgi:hypothetical protein
VFFELVVFRIKDFSSLYGASYAGTHLTGWGKEGEISGAEDRFISRITVLNLLFEVNLMTVFAIIKLLIILYAFLFRNVFLILWLYS